MIVNNVVVIRGTAYEVTDMGTQSIDSGTWVTVVGGETFLVVDELRSHASAIEVTHKPEQPFWSKMGKTKKGGKRKY